MGLNLFLTERTEEKDQVCWRREKDKQTRKQPLGPWYTKVNMIPFCTSKHGQKTSTKLLPLAGAGGSPPGSGPHLPTYGRSADPAWPTRPFANTLVVTALAFHQLISWWLGSSKATKHKENKSKENKGLPGLERAGLGKGCFFF